MSDSPLPGSADVGEDEKYGAVHVDVLADLYLRILERAPRGPALLDSVARGGERSGRQR